MKDTYKTIEAPSQGLYKDRGSKFLAYAYPAKSEEDVEAALEKLRKKHHDARHHCYAYRLGTETKRYRANDDGEPNNSAGQPILGQIRSRELTNVLVVVVRYFGGTLLGVGGLVKAYKGAASDALCNATIVTRTATQNLEIVFDYPDTAQVEQLIKAEKLKISNQNYQEKCTFVLQVPRSHLKRIVKRFKKIPSIKINWYS